MRRIHSRPNPPLALGLIGRPARVVGGLNGSPASAAEEGGGGSRARCCSCCACSCSGSGGSSVEGRGCEAAAAPWRACCTRCACCARCAVRALRRVGESDRRLIRLLPTLLAAPPRLLLPPSSSGRQAHRAWLLKNLTIATATPDQHLTHSRTEFVNVPAGISLCMQRLNAAIGVMR